MSDEDRESAGAEEKAPQRRLDAAVAKLGGKPGAVDVTLGDVDERSAFVVTFPRGASVEIVVRGAGIDGDVAFLSDERYRTRDGLLFPEEAGVSLGGSFGRKVDYPGHGPRQPDAEPCKCSACVEVAALEEARQLALTLDADRLYGIRRFAPRRLEKLAI
jgi:hypothetical protein